MNPHSSTATQDRARVQPAPAARRNEWRAAAMVLPYLWEYRGRVLLALIFLVAAKFANVGGPLVMKEIVSWLAPARSRMFIPARSSSVAQNWSRPLLFRVCNVLVPRSQLTSGSLRWLCGCWKLPLQPVSRPKQLRPEVSLQEPPQASE